MDPRKLSRPALVDFTTNAATAVANGKVTGFLAAQNTAISDALIAANASLAAGDLSVVETRASAQQAVKIADEAAAVVQKLLGELKQSMNGVAAPGGDYEAVGFDAPDTVRTATVPKVPTDVVAAGQSTGINEVKFRGNNKPQSVTYVIEVEIGGAAPYVMVGTTTAQRWVHNGVVRGQAYKYHVRAQAARNVTSGWSSGI